MTDNKYTLFLKEYKEKLNINTEISDADMENATGGVGGANEATCPKCGKPMSRPQDKDPNGPHSDVWTCDACGTDQLFTDAEYIEILKAAEAAGQTQGLVYPVWWNQVNH